MTERPKYSGVLAEPLTEENDAEDFWKRIEALFRWYEIDAAEEDAFFRLALALASDHVPGFRFESEHGKRSGKAPRDLAMVAEMLRRLEKGHSIKRAAQLVVRARRDLGFESAEAARVRFLQLTNPRSPDRGGARAAMLELFRFSDSPDEKL